VKSAIATTVMRQPQMKALVFIAALTALIFTTRGALAGDGSCVWNHIPAEIRQQALTAGLSGGPKALAESIAPDQYSQAESACGLTPANSDALRKAESGYILQMLAEQWLSEHAGLSAARLDDAWSKMDGNAKAGMERWASV
jgi:hypothetical protein